MGASDATPQFGDLGEEPSQRPDLVEKGGTLIRRGEKAEKPPTPTPELGRTLRDPP